MRWSPPRHRHRILPALLLAAGLLLAHHEAQAQDTPNTPASLEELQQAAAEAYSAGDYKKAISFMTRAYGLNPHPNYLLNIAVAYSKIGDCENARLWAQNAIDARDPALPEEAITTARAVQTDCEALENKDNQVVQNPDPTPDPAKVAPPEPIAWRSIAAYSLLGGGGVISIASVFLDLKLGKDIDDLQSGGDPQEFESTRSDLDTQQTLVTTGYLVGGLLIAAGGTLLVLDLLDDSKPADAPADAPSAASARLAPWIGPQAGGLLLHAEF